MAYRPVFVTKWVARALLLILLGYVTCGLFDLMHTKPAVHVRQQEPTTQPKVGLSHLTAVPADELAVSDATGDFGQETRATTLASEGREEVTETATADREHSGEIEQVTDDSGQIKEDAQFASEHLLKETAEAKKLEIQSQAIMVRDLPKAEADKALAEICRRMNLTLDNPEGGIGEFGRPAGIDRDNLTSTEKDEWDRGYATSGYNVYVSNRIALRRRVKDTREEMCHNISYPADLPQASVIIPYHKEALSTLMRTVFSTIERAPAHLLKEVILVDDFSESEELLGPLDEFVSYLPKVRVLRNTQREGLMRTRMRGVMAATAPVIVIKDAHTEYLPGWLEPLLAVVARNRTAIAQSNVNFMDIDQFQIFKNSPTSIHVFDFKLNQRIYPLPDEEVKKRTSPIDPVFSPAMLGTEFALDKQFFLNLGGYDPGMEIWGGEEMELSFKTWMCGGSMWVIPCSGVAHLFRQAKHRTFPVHLTNILRVAQVWMDDYKHQVYQRYGDVCNDRGIGNITERLKIRENLHCKNFQWYMQNIAYMADIPKDVITQGEIHNQGIPEKCLFAAVDGSSDPEKLRMKTRTCQRRGYEEFWMITKSGLIRRDWRCVLYNPTTLQLTHTDCNDTDPNLRWNFTENNNFVHELSGKCLSLRKDLVMEECSHGEQLQKWKLVQRPGAPSIR